MQITEEQCQKWTENPDSFVEEEDEDTFAYSVRISSQELLLALCEEFELECCASLAQVSQIKSWWLKRKNSFKEILNFIAKGGLKLAKY